MLRRELLKRCRAHFLKAMIADYSSEFVPQAICIGGRISACRMASCLNATLDEPEGGALTGNSSFDVSALIAVAHQEPASSHAIDRTLQYDLSIVLPGDTW